MVQKHCSPEHPRSFFAERYFQDYLRALRQPGSGVDPWLADALALLVAQVDCFPPPEEETYVVEYIYPH